MGPFLPYGTISITGYKWATSFLKDIIYFCPFRMEGAFRYGNDHVMVVPEKQRKNPNPLWGGQKRVSPHLTTEGCHFRATLSP